MDGVILIGDGARFTVGMVWDTRPFPTSWLRLPPTLNVPQSNCLEKFTCVSPRGRGSARGETLLVLPAETDGRPGDVELAETLERDASVDEPVEPLIAALGSE